MNARLRSIIVALVAVLLLSIFPEQKAGAVNGSRYGGSITVGLDNSIPGFCVANNPAENTVGAYRAMYETLVERDSSGNLVGLLAETVVANQTNDVWTITLRPGILYHDGSAFDAENVKYNLDARRGAITADAIDGGDRTSKLYLIGTSLPTLANISTVRVVSSLVVEVVLDRQQIDFLDVLYAGGRLFMMASAQLASRTTCATAPIGTGPFKFSGTWDYGNLTLVKNTDYWQRDVTTGNRLPFLDQITFSLAGESSIRSQRMQDGTFDLAPFSSMSSTDEFRELRNLPNRFIEYPSLIQRIQTLWINAGKASSPLSNLNARKALAYATNSNLFLSEKLGGEGEAPRSLISRDSELFTSVGTYRYDIARAREFVSAYKAETGESSLTFSMPISTNSVNISQAQFLRDMWAEAGINVNIVIEEFAVIVSKIFSSSRSGSAQNAYDLVLTSLMFGGESAFNTSYLLNNTFRSGLVNPIATNFGTPLGGLLGITHHGDSSVDAKIFQAQSQSTRKSAALKYREAVSYFQEQAFAIPLAQTSNSYFASRRIAGIGTSLIAQGRRAQYVNSWGFDWSTVYLTDTDLPIPPTIEDSIFTEMAWTGGNPRGVLADSSGEFSHVVKTNEGNICKIVLSTGAETSCVDVGGRPQGLVKVPNQAVGYFVDEQLRKLRRINLLSGSVTDVVTLAATPTGVTVNSDGSLAFVASPEQSKIYKVDLSTRQVTSQISLTGAPAGVALSPDDSALWTSLSAQNKLVRVSTFSDSVTHTVSVGDMPWGVTMSPSGRFVFVVNQNSGSISRVDVATKAVTNVLSAGVQPVAMSLSVDARRAYVANGFTNSIGVMQIPQETPLVAPAQPSAPVVPEQQSAPASGPIQQSPPGNTPAPPLVSPLPAEGQSASPAVRAPNSLSLTGTAVPIGRAPSQSLATSSAVAVSTTKVTIGLVAPTSTSKTNQIVKYTVQLKPKGSGQVITKTIAVSAGKTIKPVLTGKPGTSYKIVVTAITKAGKKQTWNGPTVSIPKKK
jgi:YVTN family beta-propeller protein